MTNRYQGRGLQGLAACAVLFVLLAVWGLSSTVTAQRVNFRDPLTCDQSVAVSMATATTTQMVALTAAQRVLVCGFAFSGGGTTTAKFVRGTGANCATGQADVTAPFEFADNVSVSYGGGAGTIFRLPTGEALCVTNGAAVQLSGVITYAKF